MGNQASALVFNFVIELKFLIFLNLFQGDGESNTEVAARQLAHFEHTFKCELHTISGPPLEKIFGRISYSDKPALITCKATAFEILEERGLSETKRFDFPYAEVIVNFTRCL